MPPSQPATFEKKAFVLRSLLPPAFQFRLSRPTVVVGRSGRCDLVLFDRMVSREHAEIRVGQGGLQVIDMQSSNGTFVDNQRIQTSAVRCGQTVKFGSSSFVVEIEDPATATGDEETDSPAIGDLGSVSDDLLLQLRNRLSKAQCLVFDLVIAGRSDKAVARKLHLSPHTVHNHIKAIFRTFGVHSRGELLATVIETCRTISPEK